MSLTFLENATNRFVSKVRFLFLFVLFSLIFGSCRKEVVTIDDPNVVVAAENSSSMNTIKYDDFLKKVDLNLIGNIGKIFKERPQQYLLGTEALGEPEYQFEIETRQVMEVRLNGHVSYVFPLKSSSKFARTFSNLTIDIKNGIVKTFINTYTPTNQWINAWRDKKLTGKFDGEVSYQEIPNDFVGFKQKSATMVMSIACISWNETFPVAYPCNSDDRHMPWEYCEYATTADGPGWRMSYQTKTVCYNGGGGGSGTGEGGGTQIGGGGGGTPNTNPFPPSTYQPCGAPPSRPNPNVPPCEEPTLVEHLISNLGITDATQINYLNSPLRRLLVEKLSDYLHLNQGSQDSQDFAMLVIANLATPGVSEDDIAATQMSFAAISYGFSMQNTIPHFNAISPYIPNASIVPPHVYAVHMTMQCAIIKAEHPEYSTWRVYYEASKEMFHLLLDGVGLVPGIGEIADLTNGLLYAIEGDGVNASLSSASAIPFVGWFSMGAKFAKKTVQLTSTTKTTLKWVRKANNVIGFGDRRQLRTVLKLAVGRSSTGAPYHTLG